MCKYCEGEKAIFGWHEDYQNVVVKMFTDKEPVLHIKVSSEMEIKKSIKINYCMFCGRKLSE